MPSPSSHISFAVAADLLAMKTQPAIMQQQKSPILEAWQSALSKRVSWSNAIFSSTTRPKRETDAAKATLSQSAKQNLDYASLSVEWDLIVKQQAAIVAQAQRRISQALADGDLKSEAISDDGRLWPVPCEPWRGKSAVYVWNTGRIAFSYWGQIGPDGNPIASSTAERSEDSSAFAKLARLASQPSYSVQVTGQALFNRAEFERWVAPPVVLKATVVAAKNGDERRLIDWLSSEMAGARDAPVPKPEMKRRAAETGLQVWDRGFGRAWTTAMIHADAPKWGAPGRRPAK